MNEQVMSEYRHIVAFDELKGLPAYLYLGAQSVPIQGNPEIIDLLFR